MTSITASPVVLSLISIVNGKSSDVGLNTWYEQIPSLVIKKIKIAIKLTNKAK